MRHDYSNLVVNSCCDCTKASDFVRLRFPVRDMAVRQVFDGRLSVIVGVGTPRLGHLPRRSSRATNVVDDVIKFIENHRAS